jgi:hypothetical protein
MGKPISAWRGYLRDPPFQCRVGIGGLDDQDEVHILNFIKGRNKKRVNFVFHDLEWVYTIWDIRENL